MAPYGSQVGFPHFPAIVQITPQGKLPQSEVKQLHALEWDSPSINEHILRSQKDLVLY